jgi:transcriptional regulator with XRE-family HTH domain
VLNAQLRQAVSSALIRVFVEERKRQGLSKNKLAQMTGLSLTMISYVERGMRNPTLDTLLRLAGALKIDLGGSLKNAVEKAEAGGTKHSA